MSADPPLTFLANALRAGSELVRRLSLWDEGREAAVRQRDAIGAAWYDVEAAVLVKGASAAAGAGLDAGKALELMRSVRLRMAQLLTCDGYCNQEPDDLRHDAESLALVLNQLQAVGAAGQRPGGKASPDAPPVEGAVNDDDEIWLRGAWRRLPAGLRRLLSYLLLNNPAGVAATRRHCGFQDDQHLQKRLTDLRRELKRLLRGAGWELHIRTNGGKVLSAWTERQNGRLPN